MGNRLRKFALALPRMWYHATYTDLCLVGPAEEDDGADDDEAEEDGEHEAADSAHGRLVCIAARSSRQGLGT